MAASVCEKNVFQSKDKLKSVSSKAANILAQSKIQDIKNVAKEVVKSKKFCNKILAVFEAVEVSQGEHTLH